MHKSSLILFAFFATLVVSAYSAPVQEELEEDETGKKIACSITPFNQ